jgi:hypothetical protein
MTFRFARLRAPKPTHVGGVGIRRFTLVESLEMRAMLSAVVTRTDASPGGHALACGCPACAGMSAQLNIDNGGLVPGGRGQAGGDFQTKPRWEQTATDPITGAAGNPITLTWGFVADGMMINGYNFEPASPSNLIASLNSEYGSEATWLPLFQSVFDVWSAKTGVSYVYQPTDDGTPFGSASGQLGVRADIRIGGHPMDGVFGTLAYNFYPGTDVGGDMVIDTNEFLAATETTSGGVFRIQSSNNRPLRNTLAHEHGHGLGLAHVLPTNGTKLMEPSLTIGFDGPQYDDFLGAQSLYGDALEKNGRNETAATASNLGTLGTGALTLATFVSTSTNDLDYFRFTLDGSRTLSLNTAPVGSTYTQGPQTGGPTAPFDAGAQADLTLNLYAADGTTLIQSVNLTSLGGVESINSLNLAAGTYVARVTGTGATQMYQLTATAVVPTPPAAPSTPVLAAASDSGDSNSDGITNITTPTFTGTAEAGSTVTLRAGATVVGSVTAGVDGSWSITSSALLDGTFTFTATATAFGGTGPASGALSVTIDTVAPTFAVAYDREVTQDFALAFESASVASKLALGEATVTLESNLAGTVSPAQVVPLSTISFNDVSAIFDVGALLSDGRYRLSVAANAVTDAAGNPLAQPISFTFAQLAGDANNNGTVEFQDLVVLSQNYNLSGKTFSQGNFNYDAAGNVDFADLVLLAQRYNLTLPALVERPAVVTATAGTGRAVTKKVSRDVLK